MCNAAAHGYRRRGLYPFLREWGLICRFNGTYRYDVSGSRLVRCHVPHSSHRYTHSSMPRSRKLSSAARWAWALS